MENRFTGVFEQVGEWWIGHVEELPGANTQGRTIEETRENLKEAVRLILESNREIARRDAVRPRRHQRTYRDHCVKRRALIRYLTKQGCEQLCEGSNHTV